MGGFLDDVEKKGSGQRRTWEAPQERCHWPVEQIGRHGICTRPCPGKPPSGTPAQHQSTEDEGIAIALQPHQGRAGGGLIEGHRRHLRAEQRCGDQGGEPQPVPGQLRRQEHAKAEPGEKDDGAAEGKGASDPFDRSCKASGGKGQRQDQPFSPAQPQKQRAHKKPEAQAQQIPQHPPGSVPRGQPQEHRGALAEQVNGSHPLKLPQTLRAAFEEQP